MKADIRNWQEYLDEYNGESFFWTIFGNSLHNAMRVLTNLRSFAVAILEIFIP